MKNRRYVICLPQWWRNKCCWNFGIAIGLLIRSCNLHRRSLSTTPCLQYDNVYILRGMSTFLKFASHSKECRKCVSFFYHMPISLEWIVVQAIEKIRSFGNVDKQMRFEKVPLFHYFLCMTKIKLQFLNNSSSVDPLLYVFTAHIPLEMVRYSDRIHVSSCGSRSIFRNRPHTVVSEVGITTRI